MKNLIVLQNVRASFPELMRIGLARQAALKLALCIKLAREASRDSWQHATNAAQAREYRRISREAMVDARYWLAELRAAK